MPILLCRKEAYAATEPGLLATFQYRASGMSGQRRAVLATKFQANGGGALGHSVELAKEQNGRRDKSTVLKSNVLEIIILLTCLQKSRIVLLFAYALR